MYQFKIDEGEVNKKLAKATSGEVATESETKEKSAKDELNENFASIDDKYSNVLSAENGFNETELNLERVEANKPSDEEIESTAKQSLADYYNTGVANLKSNAEEETVNLNEKINLETDNASKQKEKVNVSYDQAKENAKDEAIKRGLARSSIIMKQLENYDKAKLGEINEIDRNLATTLTNLNNQISSLQTKLNESLNNFDLSYAVKLQDKINSLKQEAEEKYNEAVEYNNKLTQAEAEFKAKQEEAKADFEVKQKDQELDIAKFIDDNSKTSLYEKMFQEKYKLARDFLNSLTKEEALAELASDSYFYTQQLGSYFFPLFNEMQSR